MTIRFKKYWKGHLPGKVAVMSQKTERRLIVEGVAVDAQLVGSDQTINKVALTAPEKADLQGRIDTYLDQFDGITPGV